MPESNDDKLVKMYASQNAQLAEQDMDFFTQAYDTEVEETPEEPIETPAAAPAITAPPTSTPVEGTPADRYKAPDSTQQITPEVKGEMQQAGEASIKAADTEKQEFEANKEQLAPNLELEGSLPPGPLDAVSAQAQMGQEGLFEPETSPAEKIAGYMQQPHFEAGNLVPQLSIEQAEHMILTGGSYGMLGMSETASRTRLMDTAAEAYGNVASGDLETSKTAAVTYDKAVHLAAYHNVYTNLRDDDNSIDLESETGSAAFAAKVAEEEKRLRDQIEKGEYQESSKFSKAVRHAADSVFGAYDPFYWPGRTSDAVAAGAITYGFGVGVGGALKPFAPKASVIIKSAAEPASVGAAAIEAATISPWFAEFATKYPEYGGFSALAELGSSVIFGAGTEGGLRRGYAELRKVLTLSPKLAAMDPFQVAARLRQSSAMYRLMTGDVANPYLSTVHPELLTDLFYGPSWRPLRLDEESQAKALAFTGAYGHLKPFEFDSQYILHRSYNAYQVRDNQKYIAEARTELQEFLYGGEAGKDARYTAHLNQLQQDVDVKLFGEDGFYSRINKYMAGRVEKDMSDPEEQARMLNAIDPDRLLIDNPRVMMDLVAGIDPKTGIITPPDLATRNLFTKEFAQETLDKYYATMEKALLPGFLHAKGIFLSKPAGQMEQAILDKASSLASQAKLYTANIDPGVAEGVDPRLKDFLETYLATDGVVGGNPKDFEGLARQIVEDDIAKLSENIQRIGLTKSGEVTADPKQMVTSPIDIAHNKLLKAAAYVADAQRQARQQSLEYFTGIKPTTPTSIGPATSAGEIEDGVRQFLGRVSKDPLPAKVDEPMLQLFSLFGLAEPKANFEANIVSPEKVVLRDLAKQPFSERRNIKFPDAFTGIADDLITAPEKAITAGSKYKRYTYLKEAHEAARTSANVPAHIQDTLTRLSKPTGASANSVEGAAELFTQNSRAERIYTAAVDTLRKQSVSDPDKTVSPDDVFDAIEQRIALATQKGNHEEVTKLENARAAIIRAEDQLATNATARPDVQLDSDDIDYDADGAAELVASPESIADALTGTAKDTYLQIYESLANTNISVKDVVTQLERGLARTDEIASKVGIGAPGSIEDYKAGIAEVIATLKRQKPEAATADPAQRKLDEDKLINWFTREFKGEDPTSLRQISRDQNKLDMRQRADVAQKERARAFRSLNGAIDTMPVNADTKALLHKYKDTQWNILTREQPDLSTQDKIRLIKSRLAKNVNVKEPSLSLGNNLSALGIDGAKAKQLIEDLRSPDDESLRAQAWQEVLVALNAKKPGPKAKAGELAEYEALRTDIMAVADPVFPGVPEDVARTPKTVGPLADEMYEPYAKEIRGADEVQAALVEYGDAIQQPSEFGDRLIKAVQSGDFSGLSPEQVNTASLIKSAEAQIVRKLQKFTGSTAADLPTLLKHKKTQTLLKANDWLQAETRAYAGTPQEQGLVYAQITLRDMVNGTNVVKDAMLATTAQRLKTLDDALVASDFDLDAISTMWLRGAEGQKLAQNMAQDQVRNTLVNQGLDTAELLPYVDQVGVRVSEFGQVEVDVPDQLNSLIEDLGGTPFRTNLVQMEDPVAEAADIERAARITHIKARAYDRAGIELHDIAAKQTNVFLTSPTADTDLADLAKRLYGATPVPDKIGLELAKLDLGIKKFGVDDRTAAGLVKMHKRLLTEIGTAAQDLRRNIQQARAADPTAAMTWDSGHLNLVDLVMFRRRTLMLQGYEESMRTGKVHPETLKRLREVELKFGPGFDKSVGRTIDSIAPGALEVTEPELLKKNPDLGTYEARKATKKSIDQIKAFTEKDLHFVEAIADVQDNPQALTNALRIYNEAIMKDMAEIARVRSARAQEAERLLRPVETEVRNITGQVSDAEKAVMAQRAEGAEATPLAEKVIGQPETNPEFERAEVYTPGAPESSDPTWISARASEGAKQGAPLAERTRQKRQSTSKAPTGTIKNPGGAPNNTRAQAKAEEKARRAKEVAERKALQEAAKRTAIEEQK